MGIQHDTIEHFLAAEDVAEYFRAFRAVAFEKNETTTFNRALLDSDCLITAEK